MKYRIAYVSDGPIKTTYSGIAYFINDQLNRHGFEVVPIEVELPVNNWVKFKKRLFGRLFNRVLVYKRDELILNEFARRVEKKINEVKPDLLFSHYEWILSNINTNLPVIAWPDNCFVDFPNFYSTMKWSSQSVRNGMTQTKRYFTKATHTVYSSEWALRSCLRSRLSTADKVSYIPYGDNFVQRPSRSDVVAAINGRTEDKLHFIWVGLDSRRKGLSKAIRIVNELNKLARPSVLHIVGVNESSGVYEGESLNNCIFYGKLNKFIPEELTRFYELLFKCHFMLFPTNADCTPMVVAEANAFGVPVLTHKVGGLESLVIHGRNGGLFPKNDRIDEFVEFIKNYTVTKRDYEELALSSHNEVDTRLNWEKSGGEFAKLLKSILEKRHMGWTENNTIPN